MHNIHARSFEKKRKDKSPILLKLAIASLGLILINPRFTASSSRRSQRYLKDLKNLHKISLEITSQLEIKELLPIITRHSVNLVNGIGGFVCVLDKDAKNIAHACLYNLPEHIYKKSAKSISEIVKNKFTFVTDNYPARPSAAARSINSNFRTAILVPVLIGDNVVGVIAVYGASPKRKSSDYNRLLLETIARQSSVAFENAMFYARTKTELERERHIAEELQRSLLPNKLPNISDSDIGTYYASSTKDAQVGGDFYDLISLPNKKYAIMIGDVSGKGVAAAASTAMVKYIIRTFLYQNASPAFALSQANTAISKQLEDGTFVTVFCAAYDAENGHITYANAGHPRPYYYNNETGLCSELKEVDPALTLLPGYKYQENRILLTPQSFVATFTDGTFEAKHDDEFFGEERLFEVIQKSSNLPAQRIANNIVEACLNFSRNKLEDDIAIFILKRT